MAKRQHSTKSYSQLNDARFQSRTDPKSAPKRKPVSSCCHFKFTINGLLQISDILNEISFTRDCFYVCITINKLIKSL